MLTPLNIKLRASRRLAAILVFAHAAAIALVTAVGLPLWLKLVVAAVLVASCLHSVRHSALLVARASTIAIEISSDDVLTVQTRRGDSLECEVLTTTYVASFLTVLNLREVGRKITRHVVVLPDSMAAADFRSLRTWLRWKRAVA